MGRLIADSGGTKTDWAFITDKGSQYFKGSGLHPAYMTSGEMSASIEKTVRETPDEIFFYGAGCHGEVPAGKVRRVLAGVFPDAVIHVTDDLTGVARAHLQQEDGLIAALGTGSICGRYQSGEIIARSAALGYAIGDEGSGADLGRAALKSFFRRELDNKTSELVADRLRETSYSVWMDKIYGSDRPNRELASVAGLVFVDPLTENLRQLIRERFTDFFESQFKSIKPGKNEQVVCTGTVAVAHSNLLQEVFSSLGYAHVDIREGVIAGLSRYHAFH